MSTPTAPTRPAEPPRPVLDAVFGVLWPDQRRGGRPRLVGAALGVGLLAAIVVPFRDLGVGTFLVLVSVYVVVAIAARDRLDEIVRGLREDL